MRAVERGFFATFLALVVRPYIPSHLVEISSVEGNPWRWTK